MSRYRRAAVLAAWIVAGVFLFSSATPAALADSNGAIAKVRKKAKSPKSKEKPATQKKAASEPAPDKKANAGKSKSEEKYDDFNEDSQAYEHAAKSETKPAKVAEKAAKAAEKSVQKLAAYTAPAKTVVRFSLHGEYPEGPSEDGMFGDLQPTLGKLIERLNKAAADKEVRAVWLRVEDLELGRGKVNEVRAAIARVRKAGKPVYAELTSANTGAYLVAVGLRSCLHARLRRAHPARGPRRSDLLQGPAGQAGPEVRRLADGQIQRRRRAAESHEHERPPA